MEIIMELKGKKVNFLGDSITEGAGTSGPEHFYVNVFAALTGAVVRNYGVGGTRIARNTAPSENPQYDRDFNLRADEMDPDADIVVVFGGTNDFGHGDAPLGNMESRDEHTFYGALHTLCRKLYEKYPDSEIVFMTPTHRLGEDRLFNERGVRLETSLSGYVDIIKEVTRYYSIPTLDLYSMSGLTPKFDIIKEKYMPDGLHPSDAGAEILAKRLASFLRAL